MRLIEYAGTLCAIGLQWETSYSSSFSKKQIQKRGRNLSASHYVSHVPQESGKLTRTYGFGKLPKLSKEDRKQSIYSLASLIARDRSDSFCIAVPLGDEDGEQIVAFIGILEGQPAGGFDLVGKIDAIKEQAQAFLSQNGIGRYYYLAEYEDPELNMPGFSSEEFTPSGEGGLKIEEISKLLPIPSQYGPLVATVTAAVCAGAAGMYFVHQSEVAEQERLARGRISPEIAYMQTRDSAFKLEANIPANAAFKHLSSLLFMMPTAVNGWVLSKVECQAIPTGQAVYSCPVKWSPQGGTYETFEPPIREAKVSYDANLALVTMEQDVKLPDVVVLKTDHLKVFPQSRDFIREIGSVFQDLSELGFKPSLGKLQSVGIMPMDAKFQSGIYRLEWSLEGPIDRMQRAMEALPPSMTLNKVDLQMPSANNTVLQVPRISVSGVAYVR